METDETQNEPEGHIPWAALQSWYQGLEPGGGLTRGDVERHFEACRTCRETVGEIEFNLRLDTQSWEAEYQAWRQRLGDRSPVADLPHRVEVTRFWELLRRKRDDLARIRANPDEEERNAELGKLLSELHSPEVVLMMDIWLGGVPELWKRSREIAQIRDTAEQEGRAEELAAACKRLLQEAGDDRFALRVAKLHPEEPIPLDQAAAAYDWCSNPGVHLSREESWQISKQSYWIRGFDHVVRELAARQTSQSTGSLGGRGSRKDKESLG
jgi:hypothetical protein